MIEMCYNWIPSENTSGILHLTSYILRQKLDTDCILWSLGLLIYLGYPTLFDICCFFSSELTQIIGDVIADPTLPRTEDHPCPKCAHKESVFFQSHSTRAEVCTYIWGCTCLYNSWKCIYVTNFELCEISMDVCVILL